VKEQWQQCHGACNRQHHGAVALTLAIASKNSKHSTGLKDTGSKTGSKAWQEMEVNANSTAGCIDASSKRAADSSPRHCHSKMRSAL